MNNCIFIGRLTHDLELKTGNDSSQYTYGRLAVIRPYNASATDFFSFTASGNVAATMTRWLGKGNRVAVEGYFKNYSYTRKGVTENGHLLVVERWEFADDKRKNSTPPPDYDDVELGDVELPF